MNIEYKKLRSATNILGDFCYVQVNCKIESDMARNSAGAVIKLPRHVYSPNSEASVSNDGKIPGFCKFLFLASVIKFDNEMSEVKTKITIAQLLFMQSQNLLSKTRTTLLSTGNSIILEIAATLLFICVTSFH